MVVSLPNFGLPVKQMVSGGNFGCILDMAR